MYPLQASYNQTKQQKRYRLAHSAVRDFSWQHFERKGATERKKEKRRKIGRLELRRSFARKQENVGLLDLPQSLSW